MFMIIPGHILGFLLGFFFRPNFQIKSPAKLYLVVALFVGFLVYQLYCSVKHRRIYFRGTIEEKSDPSRFGSVQFGYSLLNGCMVTSFLVYLLT